MLPGRGVPLAAARLGRGGGAPVVTPGGTRHEIPALVRSGPPKGTTRAGLRAGIAGVGVALESSVGSNASGIGSFASIFVAVFGSGVLGRSAVSVGCASTGLGSASQ